jgi:sugar phosphate isomerase/epimerase
MERAGREMSPRSREVVENVLYMLWDVGFKVGHAVRSLKETFQQALKDHQTMCALLESRFITGERAIFDEFEDNFRRQCVTNREKEFLDLRSRDVEERHARAAAERFGAVQISIDDVYLTRAEREARTYQVIDETAAMGVPIFACHVGFVPEDHAHPNYAPVRDLVRRICDYAAKSGITFALETGQEPAASLLHFLEDVDRPNLKLNFDPANLILYGTSEPIAALELVGKHVVSVHAKDGNWPDPAKPGTLGTEMPLGQGSVGMANFVNTLKKVGYTGPLTIEREVSLDQDMDDRHQAKLAHVDDIKAAIELLRSLR